MALAFDPRYNFYATKTIRIPIRRLTDIEKELIDILIAQMRLPQYRRLPITSEYIYFLSKAICHNDRDEDIPEWTAHIWGLEYERGMSDLDRHQHDVDCIIANSDLARLGYFLRKHNDNLLRKTLRKSWKRITMAEVSSLKLLRPGHRCPITYTEANLNIVNVRGDLSRPPEDQVLELLQKMNSA